MPKKLSDSAEELEHLKIRVRRMAKEKSYFQLMMNMMNRLHPVSGLQNIADKLLEIITDNLGGVNSYLYYFVGQAVFVTSVFTKIEKIERIDDPLVNKAIKERKLVYVKTNDQENLMRTSGQAWTATGWALPLQVGNELIGVIMMEQMILELEIVRANFETFFNYAAFVLKNEIRGHEKIQEAYNQLKEKNKILELEIQERIRVEAELKRAKQAAEEANILKTEFLANISHELRNPMHQILSYSKYGIDKIEKPKQKLLHYFIQSRKAAERLMLLLNDLLDLSKMEAGRMDYKMETFNVYQIINEALSELKPMIEEKDLSLKVVDPSILTKVICDYYKVGQVIRNLLSNAIKFTPEGRNIDIRFERNELEHENNTVSCLQVSVCDQGVGIPENELMSVFDKFTQSSKTKTGAGGTGLGLSICREIVKAHHGKIWVKNNPEGGATFSFTLPYKQDLFFKKNRTLT